MTISLRHRLWQRVSLLIGVAFLIIGLTTLYFIDSLNKSAAEKNLALRHQVAEQAFNNYLARAEGEINFIGQRLSFSQYEEGRELDLLFSHHEVLFFGGLDFFYIEWGNGERSMDPRARLFTEVDLDSVLQKGLINRWVFFVTQDDSILLMYKKKMISEERDNIGFLYGFISLNDNLTLASELLESTPVNGVRIYGNGPNNILLEEYETGIDLSKQSLVSRLPLKFPIQADLELEIIQENTPFSTTLINAIPLLVAIGGVLLCFHFLLVYLIDQLVFSPLRVIVRSSEEYFSPFSELQPIQLQNSQYRALIEAKDHRFKLLTESIHSAIIFCSEVTEVEIINAEAKVLFPESEKARTVFDFMPISCHRAIKEALKGGVGITFELTIANLGRIYKWQAYSFKNESSYRGLLLVGRNMTQETSLLWQLEQLQPLASSAQRQVDTKALLSEFSYLSSLPQHITTQQFQGWISLLISTLDDISQAETKVSYTPLGEVLCEESARVMSLMGVEANRALLDCSLIDGEAVIEVDASFRSLMRVLFMMVMSNDMAERRLTIRFKQNELELIATHDMTSRPLFFWMIKMLMDHLGGEQKTLRNNALKLNFLTQKIETEAELVTLSPGRVVAWVANDYPNSNAIKSSLIRLGLKVEEYVSVDSFFTQFNTVVKFDAVLIGCDKGVDVQSEMTGALRLKYNRVTLPILWLNSIPLEEVDPHVFTLHGCPFDYNLHQSLVKAFELEGIDPIRSTDKGRSWIMVGGSRVAKAIWYTELNHYGLSAQWLTDLSNYRAVLAYHADAVVVLLEPQSSVFLKTIHSKFPEIQFFSLQSWPEMPDNVVLFEMKKPYSGGQIRLFTQGVMQQS
ncbi:hypothetical protein MUS1_00055 [Marinomonas ushuaiensis DSM 15871]|uniref:Uncharacterized protein n=1 Tax=Marinomonas ushuaiensis DSM 15871 TaxID=1122207 RepID=X7E7J4_9GAMM|nr:hypothetical protein MUS1_00055 [Marinomonas ushuaiensis DSM 15871]